MSDSEKSTSSYSESMEGSEESEDDGKNKIAKCIGQVANWSSVKAHHLFDKPDAFIPEVLVKQLNEASPKISALLNKIKELDVNDMKKHGHLFKHMIFSGNPSANYGAKIVGSALIANGFETSFTATSTGVLRHINEENLLTKGDMNFSMLLSKPIYGKPMTSQFKKRTLEVFNMRPDNIQGDLVRFICLDGGFREGIDLFDIKYIHLLEPTPINADERQAIGRGTRFCGQKGLSFHPEKGWPLFVYRYEVSIPNKLNKVLNADKFLDLQLKYSDIDLREVIFAAEIEEIAIEGAVDKELTKSVHEFKVPSEDSSQARHLGGAVVTRAMKKKLYDENKKKEVDDPNADTGADLDVDINAIINRSKLMKDESAFPTPKHIMSNKEIHEFVHSKYLKDFKYPPAILENGCEQKGGEGDLVNHLMEGGAPSIIASFTKTQDFVRHFFQPSSAYKGMLLFHSVGTGKSCSGIATASTSFERDGYTILWVTRHTLKADIAKNLYGIVCSIPMQERLKDGKKAEKKFLSKNWMNPISYKQFSNMLLQKNKVYSDIVERNGKKDPLHKTLIIIDEAHKLYGPDTPAAEKPNMEILEQMLQNSYSKSGKDSARVILMTATPYTKSALEMVKLLNLLRPTKQQFPSNDYEEFAEKYLDMSGKFTVSGRKHFLDNIAGYISYLNRSSDARNFAYPIIQNMMVEMSLRKEYDLETKGNKFSKEIKKLMQLKKDAKDKDKTKVEDCVDIVVKEYEKTKSDAEKLKDNAIKQKLIDLEECKKAKKEDRSGCKAKAMAEYKENIENTKILLKDALEVKKQKKKDCNVTEKVSTNEIINKITELKIANTFMKEKKKIFSNKTKDVSNVIKDNREEFKSLKDARKKEFALLKAIKDNNERKLKRKQLNEKYTKVKEIKDEISNLTQIRQQNKIRGQLVSEDLGSRFPEDMSQETALLRRCKLDEIPAPPQPPKKSPKPKKVKE